MAEIKELLGVLKKEWEKAGIHNRKIEDLFDSWMSCDKYLEHSSELINVLVDLGKDSHDDLRDIVYELIKRKYGVEDIAKECLTFLTEEQTLILSPREFIMDRIYEKIGKRPPSGARIGKVDVVFSFFSLKEYKQLICAIEVSVTSRLKKEAEKLKNVPADIKIIVVPKDKNIQRAEREFEVVDVVPIHLFDKHLESLLRYYECKEWEWHEKL